MGGPPDVSNLFWNRVIFVDVKPDQSQYCLPAGRISQDLSALRPLSRISRLNLKEPLCNPYFLICMSVFAFAINMFIGRS
jgi:hypothetical protein